LAGQSAGQIENIQTLKPIRKFCPDCDVEYTWSVTRRYQLGYIKLTSPVTHIWFLKGTPSYLSLLLDIKKRHLQNITYCSETLTLENSISAFSYFHFGSQDLILDSPSKIFTSWQNIMNKTKDPPLLIPPPFLKGGVGSFTPLTGSGGVPGGGPPPPRGGSGALPPSRLEVKGALLPTSLPGEAFFQTEQSSVGLGAVAPPPTGGAAKQPPERLPLNPLSFLPSAALGGERGTSVGEGRMGQSTTPQPNSNILSFNNLNLPFYKKDKKRLFKQATPQKDWKLYNPSRDFLEFFHKNSKKSRGGPKENVLDSVWGISRLPHTNPLGSHVKEAEPPAGWRLCLLDVVRGGSGVLKKNLDTSNPSVNLKIKENLNFLKNFRKLTPIINKTKKKLPIELFLKSSIEKMISTKVLLLVIKKAWFKICQQAYTKTFFKISLIFNKKFEQEQNWANLERPRGPNTSNLDWGGYLLTIKNKNALLGDGAGVGSKAPLTPSERPAAPKGLWGRPRTPPEGAPPKPLASPLSFLQGEGGGRGFRGQGPHGEVPLIEFVKVHHFLKKRIRNEKRAFLKRIVPSLTYKLNIIKNTYEKHVIIALKKYKHLKLIRGESLIDLYINQLVFNQDLIIDHLSNNISEYFMFQTEIMEDELSNIFFKPLSFGKYFSYIKYVKEYFFKKTEEVPKGGQKPKSGSEYLAARVFGRETPLRAKPLRGVEARGQGSFAPGGGAKLPLNTLASPAPPPSWGGPLFLKEAQAPLGWRSQGLGELCPPNPPPRGVRGNQQGSEAAPPPPSTPNFEQQPGVIRISRDAKLPSLLNRWGDSLLFKKHNFLIKIKSKGKFKQNVSSNLIKIFKVYGNFKNFKNFGKVKLKQYFNKLRPPFAGGELRSPTPWANQQPSSWGPLAHYTPSPSGLLGSFAPLTPLGFAQGGVRWGEGEGWAADLPKGFRGQGPHVTASYQGLREEGKLRFPTSLKGLASPPFEKGSSPNPPPKCPRFRFNDFVLYNESPTLFDLDVETQYSINCVVSKKQKLNFALININTKPRNHKQRSHLFNNIYTLSHRERWDNEKDWQVFLLYNTTHTEYTDVPIFAYKKRLFSPYLGHLRPSFRRLHSNFSFWPKSSSLPSWQKGVPLPPEAPSGQRSWGLGEQSSPHPSGGGPEPPLLIRPYKKASPGKEPPPTPPLFLKVVGEVEKRSFSSSPNPLASPAPKGPSPPPGLSVGVGQSPRGLGAKPHVTALLSGVTGAKPPQGQSPRGLGAGGPTGSSRLGGRAPLSPLAGGPSPSGRAAELGVRGAKLPLGPANQQGFVLPLEGFASLGLHPRETTLNPGAPENLELSNAFYSGPGIIKFLLDELTFLEIQKIDKQNRLLLYQLNKNILKLKKRGQIFVYEKKTQLELKELYTKRALLIRRTKLVRKLFRKDSNPSSMILTILPVIPPDLRPIVKMGGQIAASDLNRLYQRVIYRNERLKKFLKDPATNHSYEMKYAQRLLQEAVDNLIQNGKSGVNSEKDSRGRLLKSLSDNLKGKQGRFRQFLLGKRVDYSGRSVIVVGPKLQFHECGIPVEMAKELYLPFLLKIILNKNYAKTVIGAKNLMKTNPSLVQELLREIMQVSPVLLNRAPTLHRLGIQAFVPKLVEGRAILLHPLVCSAFNADFDGDQMAVHVPITIEARSEAWKLMLSRNNILSPATGDPLAIPSQDMVLGCYYLTTYSNIGTLRILKGSGFYFNNFQDVRRAYYQQKVDIHALIWVKWNGKVENGTDQEEPIELRLLNNGNWQEISANYHRFYDSNNLLVTQYIATTPGRILWNLVIFNII
jgi:hypothetical protein